MMTRCKCLFGLVDGQKCLVAECHFHAGMRAGNDCDGFLLEPSLKAPIPMDATPPIDEVLARIERQRKGAAELRNAALGAKAAIQSILAVRDGISDSLLRNVVRALDLAIEASR